MNDYLKPIEDDLPMRQSGIWAQAKLDYLKRYINVFETSMRKKWPKRNYIDLFAGPGKNLVEKTGEVLLGSPLLALTTQHPFTGYYFVDNDPRNVASLTKRIEASEHVNLVRTYVGDSNQLVNSIAAALMKEQYESLNLAFLDPEGFELHWMTVARLASVRKMDLIINYSKGGLNRILKQCLDAGDETPLDKFFGGREWRDVVLTQPKASHHRGLLDLYKRKLQALGYQDVRNSDELGDEPLMRNEKQAPLYHLIFASKSDLGHKFWYEVTRRDVFGQRQLPFE